MAVIQPAHADTNTPVQMVPATFADLAAKVTPAVVNISSTHVETADAEQQQGMPDFKGTPFEQFFKQFMENQGQGGKPMKRKATALGSGFVIDPTGYIVTNNHVIESATEIQVTTNDGVDHPAKLIGADPKTDLALLKIETTKPIPYVQFRRQRQVAGRRLGARDRQSVRPRRHGHDRLSSRPAAATSMKVRSTTSCRSMLRSTRAIPAARPST